MPTLMDRPKLDRLSKVPLYFQLADLLRTQITRGDIGLDKALPGEQELITRHGVSRITVRRALEELVRDGMVVRLQGRGTFVSRPKIQHRSDGVLEFIENMRALGYDPASQILDFRVTDPNQVHESELDPQPGECVTSYVRVALAGGEPVSVADVRFAASRDMRIEPESLLVRSIVPVLRDDYGVPLASADQTIEAMLVRRREAALLKLGRGDPVLVTTSIVYDHEGRRRVVGKAVYRADRYKYSLTVPIYRR